jgi:CHAD domain-containing protein
MSYRFKSKERPSQGLKRIYCEEIEAAIREAKRKTKARGAAVHEFRKHLKKLRAALRLAAKETGKGQYRRQDHSIRAIAKLAANLRDAHVRLQTVMQLRKQFDGDRFEKVFQRTEDLLSMELASFSAAFSGWENEAARKLKVVAKHISRWRLKSLTWKNVCAGVAASYRRGQTGLACVLDKPAPKNFHTWRRGVKDLWYQLRLLEPLNRTVLEEIAGDARTLGQLLGQHHDLCFLLDRLDQEQEDGSLQPDRERLQKTIRKRRGQLQRDTTELGRRFYAEPRSAFAKRISIFIHDWTS